MKYYKDVDNQVYAYNEDFEDIKEGLVPITEREALDIANPPPTKDELVRQAEIYRKQLLNEADLIMLDWRTELMLGDISDDDKDKLTEWLDYKKEVKSVDITKNPENVTWPDQPST